MSWTAWPTAGPPMPGVVAASALQPAMLQGAVNSAPTVLQPAAAAIPAGMQYSPEQWAQMQQQNWQQWAQWQQQYQQWHQQYGAEYQKSMNALAVAAPVPAAATHATAPPPPPNENKPPPPPPPDDAAQHGQYTTMPPKLGGGYTTAPPNQQYTTGPPPNFQQQPQNQWQNTSNKRPLLQREEYDSGKRQMVDNQGQWNKPTQQPKTMGQSWQNQPPPSAQTHAQPPKATGQSWQTQPPPSSQTHAQKILNLEELTIAEQKFDKEFAAWEAQFNKWKDQNANHPDKTQYREYEKKWESWRNSLLERREQMRKKRLALQASMAQSAPPAKPVTTIQPQQSFNQPPPATQASFQNQKNQPPVDIFSKPPPTQNNEPLAFKPPKGYPGEEVHQQEGGTDFLTPSTSASGGIPGLDLVKEGQNQDLPEKEPDEPAVVDDAAAPATAKGPDLDAISKGINTILGDSKLMNMLSMVSQNQGFAPENTTNTQPDKLIISQPPPHHQSVPKSNQPIPSLLSMPIKRPPPMDQSNQNYEEFSDQYGSGQREVVHNFDDQTRMSFSNGPNDQDIGYGNNFNSGPPPGAGRPGRNDSFNREDNRNNFGANFNDNRRDDFDNYEGPTSNRPGFNQSGNNDNQRSKFDRFDSFEGPPSNRPGFNQSGNKENQGGKFDRFDSFEGHPNNRPGFSQSRNSDNPSGKFDSFDGPPSNRPGFNQGGKFDSFDGPASDRPGFNQSRNTDNKGGKFDRFDNFEGPPSNRPGFNQSGNNDNQRGKFDRFDSFEGPPSNRPGLNQSRINNQGGKFDRFDSFEGPQANRPGFNPSGNNDNQGGGFNNRGNRNDNFNNRNDNFNNRRDNFDNRGGKFDRNNDYDNYEEDYDDQFNDNYDDYSQEYDQGYNNQRGFQNQKGHGDNYNEEGWNEDDEYDKYHDMFNEGDQAAPEVPPMVPAPLLPVMLPPVTQPSEVVPPVEDEQLFVPEVVVDYEHKSVKEPEPEISLDPIHMFDYRHKPVNRIPYPQRPIWLQGTLRNTRQFDPLGGGRFSGTDRQFDPLGAAKLTIDLTKDRYPQEDRFDKRPAFEPRGFRANDDKFRDYRNRYEDKNTDRGQERDREFGRDRERSRYDNSPRNRDKEVRNRDRVYDNRSKNKSFQDNKERPYNEKKLDLEELSDEEWHDDDTNKSENKDILRFSPPQHNTDRRSPDELAFGANPSNPANNAPVNQNITLEDLIVAPGRFNRPSRIVIILRGPPGSGKTYLAKLIKDREMENGGSAPRILSLDDYFMVEQEREVVEDGKPVRVKEMVYEYEAEMEESYRQSLTKAFKKTVTDGYFNFIVVDNVNQKVKYFGEMWSYAKQNGFQVYICQLDLDPQLCTRRNTHNRSQSDIEDCIAGWEPTPAHHPLIDATNFLQSSGSITEVEMEDVQSQDDMEDEAEDHVRSKWDTFDCSVNNLARLDGVNKPLRHSRTMEEYLQLDEWEEPSKPTKPGQKRVRWADLEEQKHQQKMKAIGFVVGQTDWKRMMDPTKGESALTQTKYIARVRRF